MSLLILIAASALIGLLWRDVRRLRERVEILEWGSVGVPAADMSVAVDFLAPAAADSVPVGPEQAVAVGPEWPAPWAAEAQPEPQQIEAAEQPGRTWNFEDVFGRRLPIWAGGITLAVAGFLIVKYSIDAGLLSPITRVAMGLLFGTTLIVGAEVAARTQHVVRDRRIPQALCGAGIATLFAAILVALDVYHLVGPMTAFVGMALVTALALGLSLRFGAPSAILGLVGGLAAPALVGSTEPNVPLLTLYLALTVGSLTSVARHQRWWWLGAAALAGGFGWGLLLILGGLVDLSQTVSVGLYTIALGVALPLLLRGDRAPAVRLVATVAGCAQMAALVAVGGFSPISWGMLGLSSLAALWLSRRESVLADVPALALIVAVLLAAAWPAPSALQLGLVLAGIVAIHIFPAAMRVWSAGAGRIDAPSIAVTALTVALLPALHFPDAAPTMLALTALLGAALAGGIAAIGWADQARCTGTRFALLSITAATALAIAAALGLAAWLLPPVIALLALGLAILGPRSGNIVIQRGSWAFGGACITVLLGASVELDRWFGIGAAAGWTALCRWAVPAAVAAIFAHRAVPTLGRPAQVVAVLLGYSALAQIVPTAWLPIVPAAMLAGFAAGGRAETRPGIATATALAGCWALLPLGHWLLSGSVSLFSRQPLLVSDLPQLADAISRLGVQALAMLLVTMRVALPRRTAHVVGGMAVVSGLVTAHIAYKQLFAIDSHTAFALHGMAERTVWELALAVAAIAAWAVRRPRIALFFGGAALAHFIVFTMATLNPFWTPQLIGLWLVPAYGTAFALAWASDRVLPRIGRPRNWAMMLLIVLFAFALLRQVAHGSLLLGAGVGGAEDIARSVLAITLAVGFLRYGIASSLRDWRLASLGLMLIAVAKVFLFDAAGLDGLLRIGSFAALGLSLIGVGWLYSRYLPDTSR